MRYKVFDFRFRFDNSINAMFATNDKQEAVNVAEDIGLGIVVRFDESGLIEIVYTASILGWLRSVLTFTLLAIISTDTLKGVNISN